jgi:hypothetical protein
MLAMGCQRAWQNYAVSFGYLCTILDDDRFSIIWTRFGSFHVKVICHQRRKRTMPTTNTNSSNSSNNNNNSSKDDDDDNNKHCAARSLILSPLLYGSAQLFISSTTHQFKHPPCSAFVAAVTVTTIASDPIAAVVVANTTDL